MEYPIKIRATDGELLHAVHSDRHDIEVREGDGLRWMHFGGDAIQAMMTLEQPSRPIIPYQIYMLGALLFKPDPDFVLNLGVGGGSFERFFTACLPHAAITSLESNPDVINLLRRYFPIPEHMPIINQDAGKFLEDCATSHDVILSDLFDSAGTHPLTFSDSFYHAARESLSNDGVLVVNLLPDTEQEMVDILVAVRKSFQQVYMLLVPYFQNTLLFCLQQDGADSDLMEFRAEKMLATTGVDLTDVTDLIVELPQRSG